MPYDRFMIAPLTNGQQTDLRPWLIPDDAYQTINNAYVWRGRIRKRFGSTLINPDNNPLHSRLRINIGNTPGPLNIPPITSAVLDIGQAFSIGNDIFTIFQLGTGVLTLSTNTGATATIDSVSVPNTVTFTGEPAATAVYWYPALPVMGIVTNQVGAINDQPVYAFDTKFAYIFNGTGWEILGPVPNAANSATWTGTDAQFFTASTWRGVNAYDAILYVTNFNPADQIKYYNSAANTWTTYTPTVSTGNTLQTARIIVPFKNRLVALNTVENIGGVNQSFPTRARWSAVGDPISANTWNVSMNQGGFINAATREAITAAQFLKDRLIVFFERSTWELVYLGNQEMPFTWQKINTELGAESTLSVVPFDKVILGIGNVGIHACNGANVERIDEKIPDAVFEIHNEQDGVFRVAGIRDYTVEMVYWTFPGTDPTATYPNRILTYNYRTGSWAFNDDSITAFGYYQNTSAITWATWTTPWQEISEPWNTSYLLGKFRQVLAGNQEGYTFIVRPDITRNAPALQITNLTFLSRLITLTVINHNLTTSDFVCLENIVGVTNLNGLILGVLTVIDDDTIQVQLDVRQPIPAGTYLGGGTLARVSQISILSKQYNFYVKQGRNANIYKVDFYVDTTDVGQINVGILPTTSDFIVQKLTLDTAPYALIPLEASDTLEQVWHPIYPQADGETIQLKIFLDPIQPVDPNDPTNPLTQMTDPNVAWSDFQLHALTFYAKPSSFRLE